MIYCGGFTYVGWFFAGYIAPNGIENNNILEYLHPTGIKICEVLIIVTQMVVVSVDLKRRVHKAFTTDLKLCNISFIQASRSYVCITTEVCS